MEQDTFHSKSKRSLSRRGFLRVLKTVGINLALLVIGGGVYARGIEPSWVDVENVTLFLPRLARVFSGMRIVQLSDLHYGGWMTAEILNEVVQMVIDQAPDMVVITGDFVMGHNRANHIIDRMDEMASSLKKISDTSPTFGVLGNHDYWFDRSQIVETLHKAGIVDLNNNVTTLERGIEKLLISGVDDVMERRARLDIVQSKLPNDGCAILLAHEPDFADISAATGRFDLQLSGHSHGGQVVFPIIGAPILPYLGEKYPSGLNKVMDMYVYTNRGVGMAMPYVRFNCRPEITVFTLEAG